ncbi:MAG: hypothetical protein K8F91_12270, partial [Candidatus Obscuribacterales bacterium]|nr:hypothetical protein [Candidatus Obscuribacterales bacterium]
VIDNLAAPFEVLSVLARDEDVDIRFSVAENHNSPPDLLVLLMEDENPYVADRAARTYKRINASNNTFEFAPKRKGELNRFFNRLRSATGS